METDLIRKNDLGKLEYKLEPNSNKNFKEAFIRYLNCLNPIFEEAKKNSEFDFILTLLGYKGLSEPGNVPFENTRQIFNGMIELHDEIKISHTKLNLFLWLYGHIIEASEPYEILANLLKISQGKPYCIDNYPNKGKNNDIPQYPHEKIKFLSKLAAINNLEDSIIPLNEIYDRKLRNSVFHSDYNIFNEELRTYKNFSRDETNALINRGLAYFEALSYLYDYNIEFYTKPSLVKIPKYFNNNKWATTIIREGKGLIGLKDTFTIEELNNNAIPFIVGVFELHEIEMLRKDKTINYFPLKE